MGNRLTVPRISSSHIYRLRGGSSSENDDDVHPTTSLSNMFSQGSDDSFVDADIVDMNTNDNDNPSSSEMSELFDSNPNSIQNQQELQNQQESRDTQRSFYRRGSYLVCAIAGDVLFNKRKRAELFSVADGTAGTLALWTSVLLTISHLLSGLVFHLLGNSLVDDKATKNNDSLALGASISKRFNIILLLFSAFQLAAHTPRVPYLGMASVVIHCHNGLSAFSGWMKGVSSATIGNAGKVEQYGMELQHGIQDTLQLLTPTKWKGGAVVSDQVFAEGYTIAAYCAIGRLFWLLSTIRQKMNLAITVTAMRNLSLAWSSIGGMILLSGMCITGKQLITERDQQQPNQTKEIEMLLSGSLSLSSIAVIGAILSGGGLATLAKSSIVSVVGLSTFSLITAWHCFLAFRREVSGVPEAIVVG